jgi:peptide-methionine (S)-S-oxide reductase
MKFNCKYLFFLIAVIFSASITSESKNMKKATFGSGCFWCTEAIFTELEGVITLEPGYAGGHADNPNYREVCTGTTGHAEVCHIDYDEDIITFTEMLEVFFATHDPTTLNQQGNDKGTQYRSVIFYHNSEQKQISEEILKELDNSGAFQNKIVTEISPFDKYFTAEDYHDNYFAQNPEQSYCRFVIKPKLDKFKKVFKDKLKK